MNKTTTIARIRADGSERPFPKRVIKPMTDEEIDAAAASDPSNPPPTEQDYARMKRVPRIKSLRRALALTQEEFATRYHITVGTLRDWEQGRTESKSS